MRLVRQTPNSTVTLLRQYPFRLSSSSDGFGEDGLRGPRSIGNRESKINRASTRARMAWAAAHRSQFVWVMDDGVDED